MHYMDSQVTLRLSSDLIVRLDEASKKMRRYRSDVIRLALEQFLTVDSDDKPYDRMKDLIGSYESGIADLGTNHRDHLLKRIRHAQ